MAGLEDEIAEVVEALRTPASAAPEIRQPCGCFEQPRRLCHGVPNDLEAPHERAIHRLLFHEGFLRAEKERPLHPAIGCEGEYPRALWRKVDDTLVWIVFGLQR